MLARDRPAQGDPGGEHLVERGVELGRVGLEDGEVRVAVPGRGRSVIGGALAATLPRAEVETTVLDGFFPRVAPDARPRVRPDTAGGEWGLPFAAEREVTRHVAEFLYRQRAAAGATDLALVRPDGLLFNGGALEPAVVRERLADVIAAWHGADGWRPAVLETRSLQLAVARGAAYFGLVRSLTTLDPNNPSGLPASARGMRVERTFGPFSDASGALHGGQSARESFIRVDDCAGAFAHPTTSV